MYRTPEELENEDVRLWTETIYQSASIFKGAPHEVRLKTQPACDAAVLYRTGQQRPAGGGLVETSAI